MYWFNRMLPLEKQIINVCHLFIQQRFTEVLLYAKYHVLDAEELQWKEQCLNIWGLFQNQQFNGNRRTQLIFSTENIWRYKCSHTTIYKAKMWEKMGTCFLRMYTTVWVNIFNRLIQWGLALPTFYE